MGTSQLLGFIQSLLESLTTLLGTVSGWLWGPILIPLLFGTGLLLSIRLRGIQFSRLVPALRLALFERKDSGEPRGDLSQFQALATALAATVGTGNIVGVAAAIAIGGPGAVFWMWVTGLVGMASKYSEAFLAVRFRHRDDKGMISGGPQYYLQDAIKGRLGTVLAIFFAIAAVIASFGIGNLTQANSISGNLGNTFGIPAWITGIVLTVGAALVLLGGVRSIGRVASLFVPIMIVFFLAGGLYILAVNAADVPAAFALIFSDAFTGTSAVGGFAGAGLAAVIQNGFARGIFSNESGMGSAAIAAATAQTNHPVRQGLVSMTQTFIDTLIVVSMTALTIVTTGAWRQQIPDAEGVLGAVPPEIMTGVAFSRGLPGQWGDWIVTIALLLFAFSTILGWSYYGERCTERLVGIRGVVPYRVVFVLMVFVGAVIELDLALLFSDVMNALMALPNLIGLIILSGLVARETRFYLVHDPRLRASRNEIDAFMSGHAGAIDANAGAFVSHDKAVAARE